MVVFWNRNSYGMTIVELLVTLLIASILVGAIYLVSRSQERSMVVEDRVAGLQSELRGAALLLTKDLRMAGYDPTCMRAPCSGFTAADVSSFTFVMRNPRNNNSTITISYSLYDSGGDGDNDLGRSVNGGSRQPVLLNVDAFNLAYFDSSGVRLPTPVNSVDLSRIKMVEFAIVAHPDIRDVKYQGTGRRFLNLQGETIFTELSDGFRRRIIRGRVFCRNN